MLTSRVLFEVTLLALLNSMAMIINQHRARHRNNPVTNSGTNNYQVALKT